ncbi:hypothetical protein [Desulforamulus aeronauticus]|uniref:hypothetical protein n=1 Tax=Desulforamulus aeronauticus TaxID=53343 RepID=UPI0009350EE3|nr:hypothetical protein [Desulforamulus aeronauticus]
MCLYCSTACPVHILRLSVLGLVTVVVLALLRLFRFPWRFIAWVAISVVLFYALMKTGNEKKHRLCTGAF